MTVGAIILAAGLSRRMGANKLSADLGGKPVLAHMIDAVEAAGLPMLVSIPPRGEEGDREAVEGAGGRAQRAESFQLETSYSSRDFAHGEPPPISSGWSPSSCREGMVIVPDHALGMGHSIAAAIRAVPANWTAALICLGDMPFVTPATLKALAGAAREDRVVAPIHDGQRGNPLVWGRSFFPDLAQLRGDTGGRSLLKDMGGRFVLLPVDDPGILIDIDTPEALAEAQSRSARCSR